MIYCLLRLNYFFKELKIAKCTPDYLLKYVYYRYGDASREPTHDEVVKAASDANAHDFISKLPDVCLF